jgi:CRP/FNR family transcriptional regulator, anaerobic regulatory protein
MRAGLREAQFPFLARLTKVGRQELGALATASVPPAKRLLQRGDRANGAYLVVAGALRVYYIAGDGREATLYRVEPGGTCVLALSSTFNDEPYPAWVDAGPGGGEFVRVPSDVFHRLLEAESAFRSFVFGAISGRLFELMRTLEETGSLQVEQRVARYLLRQHVHEPDGHVRVSQIGIASELGTAREVVFRALRSLAARKLIETGRMRIRILDIDGLARVSGRSAPARSRRPEAS